MVKRNLSLVYGGGTIGLMGAVAHGVHDNGGKVKGIIPKSLAPREVSGLSIGEVVIVDTMHERKHLMAQDANAFVALPGGFGTLEELFEVITWQQLGIHTKPIGLLNVNDYYTPLLQFIESAIKSGFIGEKYRDCVISATTPEKLIEKLLAHKPPKSDIQW
eukprot:CAMPEP_0201552110 /NCGR_PEP_ID=MMETSP0173_2-20130828/14125_1 /ASSEMBLY_ACC=CAM_ASM_000268 /TAXON_ID=218659 /ORGANISM="Vexillifera sp., Strain DIVA3 564/2" /LENGTH=160 /DNA_ID=CAMNT_0047962535 /DNA_START=136 /DNA_END=615 /DNA_ORIENTATION=-